MNIVHFAENNKAKYFNLDLYITATDIELYGIIDL